MISRSELVRLHVKNRLTYRQVATVVGLTSVAGVQYWIEKYNIRSRFRFKATRNKIKKQKVVALYKSGVKLNEISIQTHVPRTTVCYWLRLLGLVGNRKSWTLSASAKKKQPGFHKRGESHPMWKGDVLNRKCKNCGTVYRRAGGRGRLFCSITCSHAFQIERNHPCWKGGRPRHRGGRYTIWARAVILRDRKRCKICRSKRKIHAHHIKPWAKFPKLRYETSNGVSLCRKCHYMVHSKKLRPWLVA